MLEGMSNHFGRAADCRENTTGASDEDRRAGVVCRGNQAQLGFLRSPLQPVGFLARNFFLHVVERTENFRGRRRSTKL